MVCVDDDTEYVCSLTDLLLGRRAIIYFARRTVTCGLLELGHESR